MALPCSPGRLIEGVPAVVEGEGLDDCGNRVRGVVRGAVAELAGAVVALIELHCERAVVSLAGFGYFPALAVWARPFDKSLVDVGHI